MIKYLEVVVPPCADREEFKNRDLPRNNMKVFETVKDTVERKDYDENDKKNFCSASCDSNDLRADGLRQQR